MPGKNRELTINSSKVPAGALVTATIYNAGGVRTVEKGFILQSDCNLHNSQLSLFPTILLYLISTHTTEVIFSNQIVEILSSPQ